jgi:hypothetical protein
LSEASLLLGFQQSYADPCLFFRLFGDELVLMLFYVNSIVDDAVVVGEDNAVSDAITRIATQYEIKQLGELHTFLGIQVQREGRETMILHQTGYAERVIQSHGM